ncbi:MAG: hypothetical protein RBR24_08455 [Candidatus Carbobacillus sp.]|nr:hypothetical protein [Candidatus Carbobacillus sp.]
MLARRFGTVRAIVGTVHSFPSFKRMWTVAAPLGREPAGYAGLVFSIHKHPYGYAGWLVEVTQQIDQTLRIEAEPSVPNGEKDGSEGNSWRVVCPLLAVRIPESEAAKLSVREQEVLELLAASASIGEIARKL